MSVSLKHFSENELFVNAECPFCNRVLKIDKSKITEIDTGYKINVVIACKCGKTYDSISARQKIVQSVNQPVESQPTPLTPKPTYSKSFLALVAIVLLSCVAVAIIGFTTGNNKSSSGNSALQSSTTYLTLAGNVFTGVKVYYGTGDTKTYAFEILGAAENCSAFPGGNGVKVMYPDGKSEWKDREYLITSGDYFVRKDDPARTKLEYYVYPCP